MKPIIVNFSSEEEMMQTISYIMSQANDLPAIPAPEGLTIDDIMREDIHRKSPTSPGVDTFSTAELWKEMALAADRGEDITTIREAMGFGKTEFAKRWGCYYSNIHSMEKNNGALNHNSRMKLAKIVMARIQELS